MSVRSWIDYWNTDTPIYVNARHKQLHYQAIARDIRGLIRQPEAVVMDFGCGDALCAADVASACNTLYLCDGAATVRERLALTFVHAPNIRVVSPGEAAAMPERSLDLIIVNSVLQYVSIEDLRALLLNWHDRLSPSGRLILADIVPPHQSALADAWALLRFGFSGGFLLAAFGGLVRTALSDYRKLRADLGLSTYSEGDMLAILGEQGYDAVKLPDNIGHNPGRMCFEATSR